jgi:hypothetical protein
MIFTSRRVQRTANRELETGNWQLL